MKSRNTILLIAVSILIILGVYWFNKNRAGVPQPSPISSPTISEKISKTFPGLMIPENTPKAELAPVDGVEGFGIATLTEIVANLPELPAGKYYKAWLVNETGNKVYLGNLRVAKSGWLVEYNLDKYPGYTKILITQDNTSVLEGSFK